jgi:lysophospholipase L1-like esterase
MNGKSMMAPGGVLVLLIAFFWLGCEGRGGGAGLGAEAGDSATMRGLVVAYFDAVAAKNFVQLDSVVTRDFNIYEDGKIWNNDSVFHNIQYHQPFSVKFTLTDFRVFVDTRSGEMCYHERADFVVQDTVKFTLHFLSTALCRKTDMGWRIRLIHVTSEKTPEVGMPRSYYRFDTPRYIPDYYRKRLATFAGENPRRGGIVLLGNSITEFGDWKRLFGDSGVVNRGIAGDNTFGMLDRLSGVIGLQPATLFIEAGINDIGLGVPVGMIAGNIGSIVQYVRVKSPGTRVFVVSVLPTNGRAKESYPDVAGKNDVAQKLDGLLREGAVGYGYAYIDLASLVTDEKGNLDERFAKSDGLHLNDAGYEVFVTLLREKGYL